MANLIYNYGDNSLNALYAKFTSKYGDAIAALIDAQVAEEALTGMSCKVYNIMQYDLAFMLGYTIYVDVRSTSNDWQHYVTKYNLEDKRKKLQCSGIRLNDVLDMFDLPNLEGEDVSILGISTMGIDETASPFEVGDGIHVDIVYETVDMLHLITNPINTDVVYINNQC